MDTSDNNKLVEPKGYLTMIADWFHSLGPLWAGQQNAITHGTLIAEDISNQLKTLGNLSLAEGLTHIPTLRTFYDQKDERDPRFKLTVPASDPEPERTVWEIDEWLDTAAYAITKSPELAYAHFMFTHFRKPGWEKAAHSQFMRAFRLYVDYYGVTYRVTGASRMGDIWLTTNLTDGEPQPFYEKRVTLDFSKLSNWRGALTDVLEPEEIPLPGVYDPRRPGYAAKAAKKTSGRHFKHVGQIDASGIREDQTEAVLTGEAKSIYPHGTKLYVRTK